MLINGIVIMLGVVVVSDYIFYRTGGLDMSQSMGLDAAEVFAAVFTFLIGLMLIRPNFRVSLANGISRKTFMVANLPVAVLVASFFAVANQIIAAIHNSLWPPKPGWETWFPTSSGWLWPLLFHIMLYLMMILAGWFTSFIYYRSNTMMKWVISLSASFIFFLPTFAPEFYSMTISPVIRALYLWRLQNPVRGPLIILILSAFLFGLTYWLVHRAPLKD